LTSAACR